MMRHRRQNGQSLSRDLETVPAEQFSSVLLHIVSISMIMDNVKNCL
jgi:hypothetical protein